jgi:recombination associated protein RdgC
MWFRNLQIYRLGAIDLHALDAGLRAGEFVPVGTNELRRQGWTSVRPDWPNMFYMINRQVLLRFDTEERMLPSSVVNRAAKARAAELAEQQGFWPGKKAMRELKERVADELLPRAFPRLSSVHVWLDPVNGWAVVDTPSATRADDVVKALLKAVDRFPIESLRVNRSPAAVMTGWLESDEAPVGFTVDQDTELRATGESRAAVRYVKHTLDVDDLRRHIAAGKQCTRLAMTWNGRISFTLTESLDIKGVRPLDVLTEGSNAWAITDGERFDNDFALMAGELARMLADLVEALGGEARP